jgi:hypothetical protein
VRCVRLTVPVSALVGWMSISWMTQSNVGPVKKNAIQAAYVIPTVIHVQKSSARTVPTGRHRLRPHNATPVFPEQQSISPPGPAPVLTVSHTSTTLTRSSARTAWTTARFARRTRTAKSVRPDTTGIPTRLQLGALTAVRNARNVTMPQIDNAKSVAMATTSSQTLLYVRTFARR